MCDRIYQIPIGESSKRINQKLFSLNYSFSRINSLALPSPLYRVVMKFDGARIVCTATGEDFDEFKGHFTDAERGFGYIRIQMGDEMSKRRKFLFLTWIGPEVGVLKRAKMSCDKAIIKEVINVSARKDDPNLTEHEF